MTPANRVQRSSVAIKAVYKYCRVAVKILCHQGEIDDVTTLQRTLSRPYHDFCLNTSLYINFSIASDVSKTLISISGHQQ